MYLNKPLGLRFQRGNDGGAYVIKSDPKLGSTDERIEVCCCHRNVALPWLFAEACAPAGDEYAKVEDDREELERGRGGREGGRKKGFHFWCGELAPVSKL